MAILRSVYIFCALDLDDDASFDIYIFFSVFLGDLTHIYS